MLKRWQEAYKNPAELSPQRVYFLYSLLLGHIDVACLEPGEAGRGGLDGCDQEFTVYGSLIERIGATQGGRRGVVRYRRQDARQLLALLHADVSHGQDVVCTVALHQ